MSSASRLEIYKYLLTEASREARDRLLFRRPRDPRILLLVARAVARAAWRQDAQAALRLLGSHSAAVDFLEVSGARVEFVHAASFYAVVQLAAAQCCQPRSCLVAVAVRASR
eukprot:6156891-Pyramimonas_sp.AAC.1